MHVSGVDVMSTKDCLKYFELYGPVFVEWINDSSCNVLFSDAPSAKRAIFGRGKPLPPTENTPGAGAHVLIQNGTNFCNNGLKKVSLQVLILPTSITCPTCGTRARTS